MIITIPTNLKKREALAKRQERKYEEPLLKGTEKNEFIGLEIKQLKLLFSVFKSKAKKARRLNKKADLRYFKTKMGKISFALRLFQLSKDTPILVSRKTRL